jgi:hypothetical protein
MQPRSSQPLVLGYIPPGGLGRRVVSAEHPSPTMRATMFNNVADQPLGATEGRFDDRIGRPYIPEVAEIARERGFPSNIASHRFP